MREDAQLRDVVATTVELANMADAVRDVPAAQPDIEPQSACRGSEHEGAAHPFLPQDRPQEYARHRTGGVPRFLFFFLLPMQ